MLQIRHTIRGTTPAPAAGRKLRRPGEKETRAQVRPSRPLPLGPLPAQPTWSSSIQHIQSSYELSSAQAQVVESVNKLEEGIVAVRA